MSCGSIEATPMRPKGQAIRLPSHQMPRRSRLTSLPLIAVKDDAGQVASLAREVLDAGFGILELGQFEQVFQVAGVAPGEFAIDQQVEAIFEGEAGGQQLGKLFLEGAGDAIEARVRRWVTVCWFSIGRSP